MSMSYLPKEYKIDLVKQYTSDVKLIKVKCEMNPLPGTFFEVTLPGIGEAPLASCSYNKEYVDILLRNAGNVTSLMFKMKKGDSIWIRGPYGHGFPIPKLKKKNLILVAGGTGIAPITSLLNYIEQNRKEFGNVWVYLGFRDEEHVLMEERIKEWQKKFHVHVGLSNDPNFPHEHKFERGFVNEIMEKHKPKIHQTIALLCGPEPMMKAVTLELNHLRVRDNKIYWAMERRMECAFGSCGRCLIQDLYVCKDGPIFRYDVIKPRLENEESSQREV